MKFLSTRGGMKGVSFKEMILSGYADDGGMTMPETIPELPREKIKGWSGLSFQELAYEVVSLFVDESDISEGDLKEVLKKAFSTFSIPEIVLVKHLHDGFPVMELYHGRSLAFKDLSMSCIAQFYNHFLNKEKHHVTLVVVTSGDTGSSAIEAVKDIELIDIVVILPKDGCTNIQERQMTTVLNPNVHVYRVQGSSDDIDVVCRKIFADTEFVSKHHLASPSSLNFSRLMVQLVHMFYTYLKICPTAEKELEIICPTGGGGNVSTGLIARQMGLPVKFVCAVNSNNVLSRMMETGQSDIFTVEKTLSPAMDIQFPYNLERICYLCSSYDASVVKDLMNHVDNEKVKIPLPVIEKIKSVIKVYMVSGDKEVLETIKRCWEEDNYIVCPHTAVGLAYHYANPQVDNGNDVRALMATASPLKFPEAVEAAGVPAPTSDYIQKVLTGQTAYTDLKKGEDWTAILKARIENITSQWLAKH